MSPDPKTVREIARDCAADYLGDACDIAAHAIGHFGPGAPDDLYPWITAVRADLAAAVASWPDEQQPADVVTAEQQPERIVPELTEELLRTLPVPIAAAVWQLMLREKLRDQQLAAATARAEKAEAALAEANGRADKFCGAFSDAGSLAYRRGKLLDAALTRQTELAKERDQARELARASLHILRNVSDEPMRELFEVDDMDEMPAWFTGYGKPSDTEAPDAAQDGRSERVERSETSGGHGEGSNSSAGAAGLSELHAFVVCTACNGSGGYCQRCREGQAGLPHSAHIVTCPDCLGGGTYPPATEDGR